MIDPLADTGHWTIPPCQCPMCRPPISDVLKGVLLDADLTITYRRYLT